MEPVVSNEKTISTGPPGGGGPVATLAALEEEGPSVSSASSLAGADLFAPRLPFAGALAAAPEKLY